MTDTPDTVDTVDTVRIEGNTKASIRSRGWCFTVNNYTEEEYDELKTQLTQQAHRFIMGLEHLEVGTPHIQGYAWFKSARTLKQMKIINGRAHFEKAKGKPSQNYEYCSKEGKIVEQGFDYLHKVDPNIERRDKAMKRYEGVVWKDWQAKLLTDVSDAPNDRTVIWVVDRVGGQGKSFLAKYIYLTHTTIIADGKKDNVFNQLKTKLDAGLEPHVVLLDIPRCGKGYMNYGVIEQLKNGLVYSGKYEGGDCIFEPPHVIVFANFDPDYSQFTDDRWVVIDLSSEMSELEI